MMADDTFVELPKKDAKRPERKEEVKQERRRRGKMGIERHLRLSVSDAKLKEYGGTDKYAFRWINDSLGRMEAKTREDDWDKVEGEPPRVVGIGPDGRPMHAYLCRKPKEYYEEDKRAEQDEIKKQEDAVLTYHKGTGQDGLSPGDPNVYIPSRR